MESKKVPVLISPLSYICFIRKMKKIHQDKSGELENERILYSNAIDKYEALQLQVKKN